MLSLEITEVILVHFNIVKHDYQHNLRALYQFSFNKSFGKLLYILYLKKPSNSEFPCKSMFSRLKF